MDELDQRMLELRAVLTETLPYELPFGFTNENLFLSELKSDALTPRQLQLLQRLRRSRNEYTKPFTYKISRSSRSKNTLGLIHPTVQLRIAKFYCDFHQTILQACSKSSFSIRFPSEVLRIHTKGSTKDVQRRWFEALPGAEPGQIIETPYSPSFFGYRKYLLLDRFFSSNELVRLETRFSRLRMLDVSRCFFNIYTHSISWAVKEKDFSKKNSKSFSFEQQFDELMQHANYNETAGIIVGPEVSRIFAEIILQRVDVDLERIVLEKHDFISETHYAVRRYVDDFHIFANSDETLDRIETVLNDLLEYYKLFLNVEKSENVVRPFVTGVSRVKFEVSKVCDKFFDSLSRELASDGDDVAGDAEVRRSARIALDALRHIGGSERAVLISSMSEVFNALEKSVQWLKKAQADGKHVDLLARLKSVIRVLFYILSVDYRVPPIIRASFIVKEIVSLSERLSAPDQDATLGYLAYELSELLSSNCADIAVYLPLELLNTFLLGLMVEPNVFCMQQSSARILGDVLSGSLSCYFSILCGLHAINSVENIDEQQKNAFVNRVAASILRPEFEPEVRCEDYLIFCDFLSCPAVDQDLRWSTFNSKMGGTPLSKKDFEAFARCIRHTNWNDVGTGFEILKRRLPPVYFAG